MGRSQRVLAADGDRSPKVHVGVGRQAGAVLENDRVRETGRFAADGLDGHYSITAADRQRAGAEGVRQGVVVDRDTRGQGGWTGVGIALVDGKRSGARQGQAATAAED